jgi:hypothetical protein
MQMLYNSDSYTIVRFEVSAPTTVSTDGTRTLESLSHGGYELVDKFARKEIFLQGFMAESFKAGVEALFLTEPSEEEVDDYIERFASLMQQPVIPH